MRTPHALRGRPTQCAPETDDRDHQKPLVRQWLAFLGIEDVRETNAAPTLADPGDVERALQSALHEADALAAAIAKS